MSGYVRLPHSTSFDHPLGECDEHSICESHHSPDRESEASLLGEDPLNAARSADKTIATGDKMELKSDPTPVTSNETSSTERAHLEAILSESSRHQRSSQPGARSIVDLEAGTAANGPPEAESHVTDGEDSAAKSATADELVPRPAAGPWTVLDSIDDARFLETELANTICQLGLFMLLAFVVSCNHAFPRPLITVFGTSLIVAALDRNFRYWFPRYPVVSGILTATTMFWLAMLAYFGGFLRDDAPASTWETYSRNSTLQTPYQNATRNAYTSRRPWH